ncbi:cytochrome P450 [Vararia minispora EC-137]|uniref:Cytochrome P450 n=1 Tax=Vararia minispora EC-137 TaxID=1314806 RepID=A0ACB8QJN4_9AGAM|nr:cytochrome P450 [Vararia minispora EC-137]
MLSSPTCGSLLSILEVLSAILPSDNRVTFTVTACIALFFCFLASKFTVTPWRKLPPGPRGWPLIGNALELRDKQWLKFSAWRKLYGDILFLDAAGQPIVVLNSQKAAADLLDRRAGIYSDRPQWIVASDIMTSGLLVVFAHYGDLWRRMRKAAHEGLNKGSSKDFHTYQTAEALLLARAGLLNPKGWDRHLRRAAASMVLSVVYDTPPIRNEDDVRVQRINNFVQRLTRAAYPGAHWVDIFPWMRNIPSSLAGWKRQAEEWNVQDSAMFQHLFLGVKESIVSFPSLPLYCARGDSFSQTRGDDRPSLSATLIRDAGRHGLSTLENSWLAGTMYAAGAETTSAVMSWWSLAMLAYPDCQKRAQDELDAVVGRHRLPTFSDFPHLHYIRAVVKEALRWRPVDPIGLPHRSTEDDFYEGYFIPKGAIVIANVWELNRDPLVYGDDAAHFNPSRHLDANGRICPGPADTKEESHFTFGFGRRICVGRHVANNSLFIDIAICLWAFTMNKVQGEDLDIDGFVEDGLVVRPVPFTVDIQPRFPEAVALLAHECESFDN